METKQNHGCKCMPAMRICTTINGGKTSWESTLILKFLLEYGFYFFAFLQQKIKKCGK